MKNKNKNRMVSNRSTANVTNVTSMTSVPSKFKSKEERLEIVLDIARKLKNFPTVTGTSVDLYNCDFPAILQLKQVFNRYINQEPPISESGKIPFPEINRKIHFVLPVLKTANPTFILKF